MKQKSSKSILFLKGVMEEIAKDSTMEGMNCFVDGIIPPSAGLSSSSALVVAAALVTLWTIGEHNRVSRSGVHFINIS
jgi:galactokinase